MREDHCEFCGVFLHEDIKVIRSTTHNDIIVKSKPIVTTRFLCKCCCKIERTVELLEGLHKRFDGLRE